MAVEEKSDRVGVVIRDLDHGFGGRKQLGGQLSLQDQFQRAGLDGYVLTVKKAS